MDARTAGRRLTGLVDLPSPPVAVTFAYTHGVGLPPERAKELEGVARRVSL